MNYFDDINNISEALIKSWANVSHHLLDIAITIQLSAIISIFILVKLFIDPENGRANVISDVLLNVWDKFYEHPFPAAVSAYQYGIRSAEHRRFRQPAEYWQ